MHPFPLYLAAIDAEQNYGDASQQDRRPQFAAIDALPLNEPAPVSRGSRLAALFRRRVKRAGAASSLSPSLREGRANSGQVPTLET